MMPKKTLKIQAGLIAAMGCLAMGGMVVSGAWGQDSEAQKTFDQLFAQQIKKVSATRDPADDLSLAKTLLEAMQDDDGPADLRVILGRNVVSLAGKSPEGQPTVESALALLKTLSETAYIESFNGWVDVQHRSYVRASGASRAEIGQGLIQSHLDLAQHLEQQGRIDQAVTSYQKASSVASSIRSEAKESIRALLAVATKKRLVYRKIDQLKARLKASPMDGSAALALVKLYVVNLDDPTSAHKYTFLLKDDLWRKNVKDASDNIESLDVDLALGLGDWYRTLANPSLDESVQRAMLVRAGSYYQHFLNQEGGAQGLNKLKAELSLKQTVEALSKLGPVPTKVEVAGRWVDMVPLADFSRGSFRRAGKGLVGTGPWSAPLVFGVRPEGSYEVRLRFRLTEASAANSALMLHLPIAKTSVHFYVFSAAKTFGKGQKRLASFTYIDKHRALDDANPTGVPGVLAKNKDLDVLVRVKFAGKRVSLALWLQGKAVAKWSGPVASLSPRQGPVARNFELSTLSASVAVQGMQIRMLDGKLLRPESD